MNNKTFLYELILLFALIILIGMCFVPMPSVLYTTVYSVLLCAYAIFAVFVWRQKSSDEREESHKAISAESGFIIGGVVLIIGVMSQSYVMQEVDPWLLGALGAMLVVRIIVRFYLNRNN